MRNRSDVTPVDVLCVSGCVRVAILRRLECSDATQGEYFRAWRARQDWPKSSGVANVLLCCFREIRSSIYTCINTCVPTCRERCVPTCRSHLPELAPGAACGLPAKPTCQNYWSSTCPASGTLSCHLPRLLGEHILG